MIAEQHGMNDDFSISVDRHRRVVTICGIQYAFELFEGLGWRTGSDQYFQIVERDDGVITISTARTQDNERN